MASVLTLAATGLYLASSAFSFETGWIRVAIASFLLIAPIGPLVVNPRLHAIASAAGAAPDGPLPASLNARTHDPLLGAALLTMASVLFGIVYLMTNKPGAVDAVLAILIALAAGAAVGIGLSRLV